VEKFPKLLGNHNSSSCHNVGPERRREGLTKEEIWQSAAKPPPLTLRRFSDSEYILSYFYQPWFAVLTVAKVLEIAQS